jgi:hypothetical protein
MAFSWLDADEIRDLTLMLDAGVLQELRPAIRWLTSNKSRKESLLSKLDWLVYPHTDKKLLNLHLKIMTEASRFHRCSNLRKYLPDPVCEVRPSRIHGLGVFATQDIEACSYVTMYPCDGATWHPNEWDSNDSLHFGWPESVTWVERHSYQQEAPPPPGARAMAIYGDPLLHNDPHFAGHMINDGANCYSEEMVEIYDAVSCRRANCQFIGAVGAVISIRDIKAGDEILTHYGSKYWLTLCELEKMSKAAACLPDVGAQLEQQEPLEQPACQSDGVAWLDQLD